MSEPGTPGAGGSAERMQALLARAAQEQLAEQRSVAAALAEVRAQVAAVGEGLRGAASGIAVERLRADVAAISQEVRQNSTGMGERLDVLADRFDQQADQSDLTPTVSALGGRVDAVGREVAGMSNRVEALGRDLAQVAGAVDGVSGPVTELDGRLGDVVGAVGSLSGRLDSIDQTVTQLTGLGSLPDAVSGLSTQLRAVSGRVDVVSGTITALEAPLSSVSGVAEQLDVVSRAVEGLQARVDALGGDLAARVSEAGQRSGMALTERFSVIEAGITEQVTGLGGQLGAVTERLRPLEQQLSGLEDRLSATSRADAAALAEQVTATLREQLTQQRAAQESFAEAVLGAITGIGQRVERLAGELSTQSTGLAQLSGAVTGLSSFPEALAALQGDVAGVHDRLAPLGDVRDGLADLQVRSASMDALRGELQHLNAKSEGFATATDVHRLRDSVIAALTERIAAALPQSVAPDELDNALAPLHAKLDAAASSDQAVQALGSRMAAVEGVLNALGERVGEIGEAAGGVPAVAADLRRVAERIEVLSTTPEQLGALSDRFTSLAEQGSPVTTGALNALRDDVEGLGARVTNLTFPSSDQVASAVESRLTDRLLEALTPRITEAVLSSVQPLIDRPDPAPPIDPQVVLSAVQESVQSATAQSEQRLRQHVDEAVLALAEALLRRRRSGQRTTSAVPALDELMSRPTSGTTGQFPIVADPKTGEIPVPATAKAGDAATADEPAADPPAKPARTRKAAPAPAPAPTASPAPASQLREKSAVVTTPEPSVPSEPAVGERVGPASGLDILHGDEHDDEDEDGKRRPWWRPGG